MHKGVCDSDMLWRLVEWANIIDQQQQQRIYNVTTTIIDQIRHWHWPSSNWDSNYNRVTWQTSFIDGSVLSRVEFPQ